MTEGAFDDDGCGADVASLDAASLDAAGGFLYPDHDVDECIRLIAECREKAGYYNAFDTGGYFTHLIADLGVGNSEPVGGYLFEDRLQLGDCAAAEKWPEKWRWVPECGLAPAGDGVSAVPAGCEATVRLFEFIADDGVWCVACWAEGGFDKPAGDVICLAAAGKSQSSADGEGDIYQAEPLGKGRVPLGKGVFRKRRKTADDALRAFDVSKRPGGEAAPALVGGGVRKRAKKNWKTRPVLENRTKALSIWLSYKKLSEGDFRRAEFADCYEKNRAEFDALGIESAGRLEVICWNVLRQNKRARQRALSGKRRTNAGHHCQ